MKEYSVGRTIKAGTKTQFRERLATTLAEAIRDDSGRGLAALELKLRSEFGTFGGTRRMTSVLSKGGCVYKARPLRSLGQLRQEGTPDGFR